MRFHIAAMTIVCSIFLGALSSAQTWMSELVASDASAQDNFGSAVATDGSYFVVGSPMTDLGASNLGAGQAYVYRQYASGWVEEARLQPSDPVAAGMFGSAVAIDGNTIAVGAPGAQINGVPQGAVYIFERVGTSWPQVARLGSAIPLLGDEFGAAVDLDGVRLVVGAPGKFGVGQASGAAYVFERSVGWQQQAKLLASDTEYLDRFGQSVAIEAFRIAVGAPFEDDPIKQSGAVYIFEGFSTAWNETARLKASDAHPHDALGSSLCLSGDTLAVGAPGGTWVGVHSGSAFIFEATPNGLQEGGRILPNDLGAGDRFGLSVSLHADKLAVGGPRHSGFSASGGAAWFFGRSGSSWLHLVTLSAALPTPHFQFGTSVSLSATRLVVGAPFASNLMESAGAAELWSVATGPAHTLFCFGSACPCGNDDADGGCYNSTGKGARLEASGSLSLSQDDLSIATTNLRSAQFVVLFMGPAQSSSHFGDGLRCTDAGNPMGPGYHLFGPAQLVGVDGTMIVGPGRFRAVPGLLPGDTRYMQSWYRDPGGPCNSSFNISNAIAVTFMP